MPKICVWNIEEFGVVDPFRGNYLGIEAFIAHYLHQNDFDILVIEEYRAGGLVHIQNIVTRLNHLTGNNWYYDFIPGSVDNNVPNLTFNDLGFIQEGNYEGYAVLWEGDNLIPFANNMSYNSQLPGQGNRSFLNLVTMGNRIGLIPGNNTPITRIPNTNVRLGFPLSRGPQLVQTVVGGKRTRNTSLDPLNGIAEPRLVRCPCKLQVNTGNPVPLVVYHAPNGAHSSYYGTLICGLAEPLVNAANTNAIVAGDFNVTTANQVALAFNNFTNIPNPPGQMVEGTAPDVMGKYPRSMVKFVTNIYMPNALIPENNAADCFGARRDQIFYRSTAGHKPSGVEALFEMLMKGDPNYNAAFATAVLSDPDIKNMVTSLPPPNVAGSPYQAFPVLTNAIIQQLNNSFPAMSPLHGYQFPNYRAIAIFLNLFISDHLPLSIDF